VEVGMEARMAKMVEALARMLLAGCAGTDGNAGERFWLGFCWPSRVNFVLHHTSFSIGPRNGPCFLGLRLGQTREEE
jgi:hypothetical protein